MAEKTGSVRGLVRRFWTLIGPVKPPEDRALPIPKDEELEATARAETIEAMLDNLRRLVAYEEQRAANLVARGIGLAGFTGLTTAVLAAARLDSSLPCIGKVFVGIALVLLVGAAATVVLGLLMTRVAPSQSTRQVSLYTEEGYRRVSAARVQVQIIDTLTRRLAGLRAANRSRAAWVNRALLAIVLAVLSAAGAAMARLVA
jgi:hypothetical protein